MIRKLINLIGHRGVFLLFFAFLWINTGLRWIEANPNFRHNYYVLLKSAPHEVWGWCFVLTGIVMALGAFWKQLDEWSFAISAFVAGFLALSILIEYLPGVPGPAANGGSAMLTYFFYTGFVLVISSWPEPPDPPQKH